MISMFVCLGNPSALHGWRYQFYQPVANMLANAAERKTLKKKKTLNRKKWQAVVSWCRGIYLNSKWLKWTFNRFCSKAVEHAHRTLVGISITHTYLRWPTPNTRWYECQSIKPNERWLQTPFYHQCFPSFAIGRLPPPLLPARRAFRMKKKMGDARVTPLLLLRGTNMYHDGIEMNWNHNEERKWNKNVGFYLR